MATLSSKISDVQAALDTLRRQHKVPGATLGVLSGTELVDFASGVANRNTGVSVTTGTLFQIGSNTKVYTATLVMQLVHEGLVELDAPVRRYVKDLELADTKAALDRRGVCAPASVRQSPDDSRVLSDSWPMRSTDDTPTVARSGRPLPRHRGLRRGFRGRVARAVPQHGLGIELVTPDVVCDPSDGAGVGRQCLSPS